MFEEAEEAMISSVLVFAQSSSKGCMNDSQGQPVVYRQPQIILFRLKKGLQVHANGGCRASPSQQTAANILSRV